jgi:hypothetical protein
MLSARLRDIVSAQTVPWEQGEFGIAYVTRDGQQHADRIGSRHDAESIVRQVATTSSTSADERGLFPRDIAAS